MSSNNIKFDINVQSSGGLVGYLFVGDDTRFQNPHCLPNSWPFEEVVARI